MELEDLKHQSFAPKNERNSQDQPKNTTNKNTINTRNKNVSFNFRSKTLILKLKKQINSRTSSSCIFNVYATDRLGGEGRKKENSDRINTARTQQICARKKRLSKMQSNSQNKKKHK